VITLQPRSPKNVSHYHTARHIAIFARNPAYHRQCCDYLDNGDRNVGLVIKDAVGTFGFAATDELAANDDAAFGKADFFAQTKIKFSNCYAALGLDRLFFHARCGFMLAPHLRYQDIIRTFAVCD
jgi:hypothetical protein